MTKAQALLAALTSALVATACGRSTPAGSEGSSTGTSSAADAASTTPKFYVRPGATGDGRGGDWTNACPDLKGACDPATMTRGAIYFLAGGTYTGTYDFRTPDNGTQVITIRGATAANHGTSTGWQDSYSVRVAEGGQQANFVNPLQVNSDYWVIDGTAGSGQASATSAHNYGFGLHSDDMPIAAGVAATFGRGLKGVTLSHFEADGVNWNLSDDSVGAFTFYVPGGDCVDLDSGLVFDHVYVHDQKGTAWVMGGNITIQYSQIVRIRSTEHWHGEGIASRTDCGTGKSDHSVFRYNVWEDVNGTGNIVALNNTARDWQVYGNVFYATGATCLYCDGAGPSTVDNTNQGYILGLKFYNNTVYNTDGKCGAYTTNTKKSSGFDIRNNLFYGCKGGVLLGSATGVGDILDYNVYWNDYVYYCDGTGNCPGSHDNYICGTKDPCYFDVGTPPPAGDVFVNPAAFNLHVNGNTIDGQSLLGTPLGSPYDVDMNGKVRTNWTRGAYEY